MYQCAPVAGAFFQRGLNAAEIGQGGVFFVEEEIHRRKVGFLTYPSDEPFGDMPFLGEDDQQFTLAAKAGFGLPKAGGEAAADAAPCGEKVE